MSSDTCHDFQEYQLLIRVLAEQSEVNEAGKSVAKDKKKITSSSLQNPSDPDATYRHKTGMCRVLFPRECCEKCPHREECKVKEQKKNYAVHVSSKMAEQARYQAKLTTDEYILWHLITTRKTNPKMFPLKFELRFLCLLYWHDCASYNL